MTLLSAEEHRQLLAETGYTDVQVFEERVKGWICAIGRKQKAAAVLLEPNAILDP